MALNAVTFSNEIACNLSSCSIKINVPLCIPSTTCPNELAHRILKLHNLPIYHLKGQFRTLVNSITE